MSTIPIPEWLSICVHQALWQFWRSYLGASSVPQWVSTSPVDRGRLDAVIAAAARHADLATLPAWQQVQQLLAGLDAQDTLIDLQARHVQVQAALVKGVVEALWPLTHQHYAPVPAGEMARGTP